MKEPLLSAQVVLKGSSIADCERVQSFFEKAGFKVGPLVANNFSITAPENKFKSYVGGESDAPPRTSTGVVASEGLEPSAKKLPAEVRDDVEAIVFTEPPDFGPFNP
jgi:hypothetical protein